MKFRSPRTTAVLAAALLFTLVGLPPASQSGIADEGMWIPSEIGRNLPMDRLEKMGLELSAADLWNAGGPSLSDAIVQVCQFQPNGSVFGFGSAAFVSKEGLLLTNHHVAFDAIAANSNAQNNYVEKGFRAQAKGDELPCRGQGLRICTAFEDVTAAVLAGVDNQSSERDRALAVRSAVVDLVKKAEAKGLKDVSVFPVREGVKFYLVAYDTIRDLRLVYAPPQSIGEYGGDIDNWIWPRHTGDFTYLRAYVAPDGSRASYSKDNVPYRPVRHLEIDTDGYDEGDFCFIMGFPGTTYRGRTSYSVDYRERVLYPNQLQALNAAVARLKKMGENDEDVRIRNLSEIKSLNNTLKNFQGMLDGFKRFGLVGEKKEEEAKFVAWVNADPERKKRFGDVFPAFDRLYSELFRTDRARNELAAMANQSFMSGFFALAQPSTPENRQMVGGLFEKNFANLSIEEQRRLLHEGMKPLAELAPEQRPATLAKADLSNLKAWSEIILKDRFGPQDVKRLVAASPEDARQDAHPLARIAFSLVSDLEKMSGQMQRFGAEIAPLRRRLAEAWAGFETEPLYPDANSTLRFTYGTIGGYSPADATRMHYMTTPKGIVEKHTGKSPFNAPSKQIELIGKGDWGRWKDEKTGTLPINFLSNTDITGGNSGSAIMNGKGQMIGIAFDGNYEAMTSDYRFQADITRTINVDIRYVLWCTEKLAGLNWLVEAMGL